MTSFGLKAEEIWSAQVCSSSREILGRQPITSDLQAEKSLRELKGLLSHFNSKNKTFHIRARVYKRSEASGGTCQVVNSAFGGERSACGAGEEEHRLCFSPASSSEQTGRRNQWKSPVLYNLIMPRYLHIQELVSEETWLTDWSIHPLNLPTHPSISVHSLTRPADINWIHLFAKLSAAEMERFGSPEAWGTVHTVS